MESVPEPARLTAAGRVLALLDAFGSGGGALTLSEISRCAGLSLTTTHRLVREVLAWGGLDMDGDGRYRLSAKILELASASTRGLWLREKALPYLVDLQRRTGLTVHLAARDGLNVMNLEALRLHPNYGGENRIGGRLPLHVAATGLVMLAYAPPTVVDRYVQEPLKRYTAHTITDPGILRKALVEIRRAGCAVARDTVVVGRVTVAAPVMNADGDVQAAVGVISWLDRHEPERSTELLRAAARCIGDAISAPAGRPSARILEFHRRHTAEQ